MMFIKDGKLKFSVKITFLFGVFTSFLVIAYTQKQYISFKHDKCTLFGETAAKVIQSDISQTLLVNEIIESLIIENNGNLKNFNSVAKNILSQFPAIDCIQLAPKGIVKNSYPYESYSYAGENLFTQSDTKISSSYSISTKKTYLTGPIFIKDNKPILLVQHPVFLPAEDNSQSFWGFSVLYLQIEKLFREDTLDFLNTSPYNFCLWKSEPVNEDPYVIIQNVNYKIKNPVETIIPISNSLWTLYTIPNDNWFNPALLIIEVITALVFCIIFSCTVAFLTSVKDRDEALERLSFRDTLTSLYNARKFLNTLKENTKENKAYSLIYIDLNDFKKINDNLGHDSGDQVLTIVARKISNCIRESDRAFRIGGDEFTVVLTGDHSAQFVESVISRIKESISRETVLKNGRLQIFASAGFSRYPVDGTNYEEIIKIADNNMYNDKRDFKNKKNEE